ncbi:MAG: ABC transporter permease [Lysobacteraceae bacterium]
MLNTELRQAMRSLSRRPGFLLMGVLALGLGLAGVAMVYAIVNTFLWRPLPGLHPSAPLVEIGRVEDGEGFDSFSYPDFADVKREARSLDGVFAFRSASAYLQTGDEAQPAAALLVSGDYFQTLGVRAALGSLLGPQHDTAPGAAPVVVASHAAFERWFGADASRVGSQIRINGRSYTLIGVTEPTFHGHEAVFTRDFYLPLSMAQTLNVQPESTLAQRGSRWLRLGARLAPGATLEQARTELAGIADRLASAYPESNRELGFDAAPMGPVPHMARNLVATLSVALLGLCSAVLLLACFNLGGVMLAQGQARRAELAMRCAIGASRRRLLTQLLLEALLTGTAAGAFGFALAWAGRHVLTAMPLPVPTVLDLSLTVDWRVALALGGTAVAVSLAFGLWPALSVSASVQRGGAGLRQASESRVPRQHGRRALIAIQTALTVALLLFAASILRSIPKVDERDTGFRMQGVWLASVDVEPLGIAPADGAARIERLAERLRAQAGVEAAGFASMVPLTLSSLSFGSAFLPGQEGEGQRLDVNTVGEGFLDAVGLPVRGRGILRSDAAGTERVAVINAALAHRLFGADDPIGRSFELGDEDERKTVRVVGVVPDGRYSSLSESPRSFAFLSAPQWERAEFTLFIRSVLPPTDLREVLRIQTDELLPGLPAPRLASFEATARVSIMPQLVLASATSVLGGLALTLAATGLYGVLAFQVANRVREFGVRMALGAQAARIAVQVGGTLLWWLLPGVALGLLLGHGATQAAGQFLLGPGSTDPAAIPIALGLFALMALIATGVPLARILRLRPGEALRAE